MKYLLALIISLFLATPSFAGEMCEISAPHNCINANSTQSINLSHKPVTVLHYSSQEPAFLNDGTQNLDKTTVNYSVHSISKSHHNSLSQHH